MILGLVRLRVRTAAGAKENGESVLP